MRTLLLAFTEDDTRTRLGHRFEALTTHAFRVFRWTVLTGFARFLSLVDDSLWFDVIYWLTAALLLGYLASIFLLRPEIPIFARRDAPWKRVVQTVVNYMICMIVFMIVLWGIDALIAGIGEHRFGLTDG
ncbi:hypothetical protein [Pontibaca salina]|uniref:Uncharacterized protein n=1 Tax=Pontibaca salina TaxID=2795731 RepID=A0A934HNQ8_9RHOB|nr:hypothetical protein [Pontibaca salina]MBI6628952.1 hypothetical protein [Pontibaca salina]